MIADNKEFIGVADLLGILPCSQAFIYKMINSGQIPSVRLGGRLLIPAAYVRDLKNRANNDLKTGYYTR